MMKWNAPCFPAVFSFSRTSSEMKFGNLCTSSQIQVPTQLNSDAWCWCSSAYRGWKGGEGFLFWKCQGVREITSFRQRLGRGREWVINIRYLYQSTRLLCIAIARKLSFKDKALFICNYYHQYHIKRRGYIIISFWSDPRTLFTCCPYPQLRHSIPVLSSITLRSIHTLYYTLRIHAF